MSSATPRGADTRLHGLDAARGLAVLGMMAAHTWPRTPDPGELLVDGRPSVLFAVVAGVALGMVAGGEQRHRAPSQRVRARLALRAVLLLAAGLALWMLPSGIAIILDAYGLVFLLVLPFLFAPRWVLAGAAAVLVVGAPLLRNRAVELTGATPSGPLAAPDATALLLDWLLTGFYPALLWLPLVLVGMLCARSGLHRVRVRALVVGLGTLACAAGYGTAALVPAVDASAHSGTTAELVGAGGLAVALIGILLVGFDSARAPRLVALTLTPLSALGRVALSVYVGHVLIIAMLAPLGPAGRFDASVGLPLLTALTVGGVALGLAAHSLGRRGPLEATLSGVIDAALPRPTGGARLIP